MRIRSTKPEFWRSRRIAAVSWDARLVLKGLESYVDDNGVGKDDLALIVADVFPRDLSANPPGTLQRVSEAISELYDAGLVWRYAHDDTDLIYVSFWESIQRIEKPSKGRLRRPDGTLDYRESEIGASFPEGSGSIPGGLRPGTGEQGNRGTGEQPLSPDADASAANDAEFDRFWDTYGKKVDRKKSRDRWDAALRKRGVTADLLIAAAGEYVKWERAENQGGRFIMDPSRWLLGERWNDERHTSSATAAPKVSVAEDFESAPTGLTDEEWFDWDTDRRRRADEARRAAS